MIKHTQDNEITEYWKTRTDELDKIPAKKAKCEHKWEVEGVGCMGGGYVLRCKKCGGSKVEF